MIGQRRDFYTVMNGKKRWRISIGMSLLIHMVILLFLAYKIALWLPQQQVLEQQPVEDVFMADDASVEDDASDSDAVGTPVQSDSDIAMPSDNAAVIAHSEEQTQPVNKEPAANDNSNEDKPKNRPPRNRHITIDTTGQDIAKQFGNKDIPTVPIEKGFDLPDSVLPLQQPVTVGIIYEIEIDGTVTADVDKTSGYDDIDDAAIEAICKWRFKPVKVPIVGIQYFSCKPGDNTMVMVQSPETPHN